MIMIDATPVWNVLQYCQMLVNVANDCFYSLQRNDLIDSLLFQYRAHINKGCCALAMNDYVVSSNF